MPLFLIAIGENIGGGGGRAGGGGGFECLGEKLPPPVD